MKNRNKKSPAGLAARTGQAIGTSDYLLVIDALIICEAANEVNTQLDTGGSHDPRAK